VPYQKSVVVTLVGLGSDAAALANHIRDVITDQSVAFELNAQETMNAQQVLSAPSDLAPQSAKIWILLPDRQRAILYVARSEHRQLLYREIPLRSGLDELGREEIAQVVLAAASSDPAGIQATTEIVGGSAAIEQQPPSPGTLAPVLSDPAVAGGSTEYRVLTTARGENATPLIRGPSNGVGPGTVRPSGARWTTSNQKRETDTGIASLESAGATTSRTTLRLGAGYAVQWAGSQLKVRHGPSLQMGLLARSRSTERLAWPLIAAVELPFVQSYRAPDTALDVKSQVIWLSSGAEYALQSHWSLQALLGVGCEFQHATGKTTEVLTTTRESNSRIPWLRFELGNATGWSGVSLGAAALLDFSLYATHYDVMNLDDGTPQRLFAPWSVRPGFRLYAAIP
jgi:hypothetical protein